MCVCGGGGGGGGYAAGRDLLPFVCVCGGGGVEVAMQQLGTSCLLCVCRGGGWRWLCSR